MGNLMGKSTGHNSVGLEEDVRAARLVGLLSTSLDVSAHRKLRNQVVLKKGYEAPLD